jgi:hypothetical protein
MVSTLMANIDQLKDYDISRRAKRIELEVILERGDESNSDESLMPIIEEMPA